MRKTFTIIWILLSLISANAQEIKGKVIDESAGYIPGISVLLKGSSKGTITDANGNFSLVVKNQSGDVLIFSGIGFETKEVVLSNQNYIEVQLQVSSKTLSEVVVTAFGIEKEKEKLGYSVQSMDGREILKAREPNTMNALTGKIAGLTIGNSPEMLAAPNVMLRGNFGILYVVDGIPVNSDTWNISADDIETYTVLKGPNASVLYGFRGQNGAIIITTKKGAGKNKGLELSVNSSTQIHTGFLTKPQTQSEYGLGNSFRYAFGNDPLDRDGSFRRASVFGPRFEGQPIPQYDSPIDPATGKRTATPWLAKGVDNFDNFTEMGGLYTNNISMGYSDQKADLRLSYTNTNQKGVFPNTKISINNINLSLGYNFTRKLRLEGTSNLSLQASPNVPESEYGPNSYTYSFGVYGGAHYDVRDLKDYWASPGVPGIQQVNREYGRTNNPYFMAYEWLREHRKTDVYSYLTLKYDVMPGLKLQARGSLTNWDLFRNEKMPYSAEHYSVPDRAGNYREDKRKMLDYQGDVLVTYVKKLGSINLDVLLGANARRFAYNSSYLSTNNLIVPGVYSFSNSQNPLVGYSFRSNMMVLAGYSSVDIGYKNYVTLNLTGHSDRLSTLPVGNQTYFYPSASLISTISDYIKLPSIVSFAKVRASYAQVQGGLVSSQIGPANIALGFPDWYGNELMTTYEGPTYRNQNTYSTTLPYNNQPGATYTSSLANSSLKPFTVASTELGLDFYVLKNRLGADFTFFQTINGPQIFVRDMAPSSGYSSQNVNDVITQKRGVEVSITGTPIVKSKFRWEVLFNYSSFQEVYKEINDPSGRIIRNGGVLRVGDRVDKIFSRAYLRTEDGQIIHGSNGLPLNGPSGIQGNSHIGYGNNDFSWAINNKLSFKKINLSFQFDGRVGGIIYNDLWTNGSRGGADISTAGDTPYGIARRAEWESFKRDGKVTPAYIGEGVILKNGSVRFDENGNIINFNELSLVPNDKAATFQDYVVASSNFTGEYTHSRTFMKLREITLGTELPQALLAKLGVKKGSISVVARNLFYWGARKDLDVDQYLSSTLLPYEDQGTPRLQSPSVRSFGLNLNLIF
ncbi:MAG: SusC/RagA family TonB-linked outer membrane protein [Leadbetterella sp.]